MSRQRVTTISRLSIPAISSQLRPRVRLRNHCLLRPLNGSTVARPRTRGRSCDETAGIESREIVVTRCLDIVAEERDLLNHHLTLLVFRGFGFPAAILRVRNQGVEQVDTRLEDGHIDRWSRELRITVHALMYRVELFEQIGIRCSVETQQRFELLYFGCHTFSTFSVQIPALHNTTSEEGGPVRLSPESLGAHTMRDLSAGS